MCGRTKVAQWPSINSAHYYWRTTQFRSYCSRVSRIALHRKGNVFLQNGKFYSKQTTVVSRGRGRETGPGCPYGLLCVGEQVRPCVTGPLPDSWAPGVCVWGVLQESPRWKGICEAAPPWWLAPSFPLLHQVHPES